MAGGGMAGGGMAGGGIEWADSEVGVGAAAGTPTGAAEGMAEAEDVRGRGCWAAVTGEGAGMGIGMAMGMPMGTGWATPMGTLGGRAPRSVVLASPSPCVPC